MAKLTKEQLDKCAQAARTAILGDSILTVAPWKTISDKAKQHFSNIAQAVINAYDGGTAR